MADSLIISRATTIHTQAGIYCSENCGSRILGINYNICPKLILRKLRPKEVIQRSAIPLFDNYIDIFMLSHLFCGTFLQIWHYNLILDLRLYFHNSKVIVGLDQCPMLSPDLFPPLFNRILKRVIKILILILSICSYEQINCKRIILNFCKILW